MLMHFDPSEIPRRAAQLHDIIRTKPAMVQGQSFPEATLEVIQRDGSRRTVRVTESPFLIGRGAEAGNHLQLDDSRISRNCAALVYADGAFFLEDRGQRRGLHVNGKQISKQPLREGDVITFGIPDSFELVFHSGAQRESLPQLLSQLQEAGSLEGMARELRHLSLLLEATTLLQSHLTLEEVLAEMMDRTIALTGADRGLLLEADPSGELRPMLARQRDKRSLPTEGVAPSRTVLARVLQHRRSIVEQDVSLAESDIRDARSIVGQQLLSVIALPLLSHRQVRASDATFVEAPAELLGALYLDSRRPAAFSRLERQILETLAVEASSVLDNTRLAKKERERLRLEQELATARGIQQALLPKSFPQLPHLRMTGMNRPCLAVGGDYFDWMDIVPQRIAFVIADVCGKGLGAALVTAMLQGTFSAMTLGHEAARVCAHVNRFICSHAEMQRYATLFFGILDAAGNLEFINAGHPPPLLVRDSRVEPVLGARCIPVGLFPETEFSPGSYTLRPGDTLVLFTDGISEAMNHQHDQFGVERLAKAVESCAGSSIEELQAGILAAVEQFTGGAPQADDLTLLILRYQGNGRRSPAETNF